jgi:hypothetical protein
MRVPSIWYLKRKTVLQRRIASSNSKTLESKTTNTNTSECELGIKQASRRQGQQRTARASSLVSHGSNFGAELAMVLWYARFTS